MTVAGLPRKCKFLAHMLFVASLCASCPAGCIAADRRCDANLLAQTDSPYAYKLRGNRCEGLYVNQVSSTALRLASFTESFEDYNLDSNHPLRLQWRDSGNPATDVHLRAQSLQRRQYYRMDALLPVSDKEFRWPSDVLSALQIPKAELGVVAFTRASDGREAPVVYLPVSVSQSAERPKPGDYRVVVVPGSELTEVFVSISIESGNGERKMLSDGRPLRYGYYPAEQAISFAVQNSGEPGLHILQVGATLRNGGITNMEFYFRGRRR